MFDSQFILDYIPAVHVTSATRIASDEGKDSLVFDMIYHTRQYDQVYLVIGRAGRLK